jgi:2-iminobutanoate/2-iminopropanoate deaminase
MPDREVVIPASRKSAPRPYSPATAFGNFVFPSGLSAVDPVTGHLPEGIEAQTRRCLEKLDDILRTAGSSLPEVMRVTVFLTDTANHQAPMSAVFSEFFPSDPPARTTVQVSALTGTGKLIEIEAIACRSALEQP